jgi:hypothetical protein
MLQSTMLAIKGAQLVIDCAGITAGKNVLIMCDDQVVIGDSRLPRRLSRA